MYLRFVIPVMDEKSRRRQGVFQTAYDLRDSGRLPEYQQDELRELLRWFSENLKEPERFSRSRRSGAHAHAISWFKDFAGECIGRIRHICRILGENDVPTEMISTERPGYVVYEDEHQVVAEPFWETQA